MLSGLSFRSAFVFDISSLILSGFPLISFHLINLVLRTIFKNYKSLFCLPFTTKRCIVVKDELKPYYLLFRGFIFLCVQLSENIRKCFFCFFKFLFLVSNLHNAYTENVSKLWNYRSVGKEIAKDLKVLSPSP